MRVAYVIIAILLGIDNIFINFKIGGISYDRLLEFLFFFLFFNSYLKELKTNSFFKKWNTFIILFTLLQLLINYKLVIMGKIEFEVVYKQFIKSFSFLVFSFLFLLIAKKNIRYVNIIIFVHFLICVFALLQFPLSPIASQMLEIKKQLFSSALHDSSVLKSLEGEQEYIAGGYASRFRLSGPFRTSISFSYFAMTSFVIAFYMFLKHKRKLYLYYLGVLFVASVLCQTRSLLLAELCIVFGYLFLAPFKKHGIYKLTLVAGSLMSIFFVSASKDVLISSSSRITKVSEHGKSDTRPVLWATGVNAILSYPLGINDEDYKVVQNEMFTKYGRPVVLVMPPHNGLINLGFQYSILGYILFFFLVLFLLKYIKLLEPKLTIFFRLALFGYLIHTSFHNDYVLINDYPFLMVLMLIGVDWKSNKEEQPIPESPNYSLP